MATRPTVRIVRSRLMRRTGSLRTPSICRRSAESSTCTRDAAAGAGGAEAAIGTSFMPQIPQSPGLSDT
jgi:hypothetical protein